jgi:Glycosyl transferase family 2
MKLVMTLLVRDEEDIIASNIDFHLNKGVDFIIAMDNLSIDGTADILRLYERKGMLHYLKQPDDTYAQDIWVTQMARLASAQFAADWIINNDADEFWWPQQGDLKSILASVDPCCPAVAVERTNFIPRPIPDSEFFANYLTIRERNSRNADGAPLPEKVCHRALPDIEVEHGNHGATRKGRALPTTPAPITILHFPMRTYRPTRLPRVGPPMPATSICHRRSVEPGGNSTRSGSAASSRPTIRR